MTSSPPFPHLDNLRRNLKVTMAIILSIIAVYLSLVCGSLFLAGHAIYIYWWHVHNGVHIYNIFPMVIQMLGGFAMAFILLRLLFVKNKEGKKDSVSIKREEAPELFALIEELTKSIGTEFPANIYLNAGVNACVFYDSSFRSLFFKTRKNLEIGIGLVNSLNAVEFKSVLAHEFGHFSQKELRAGSYVYQTNKILYNLYVQSSSRNTFGELFSAGIYGIMIGGALLGISEVLNFVVNAAYRLVNNSYRNLSHDLEFHADYVAATHCSAAGLSDALMRLEFSETALQEVLDFYSKRISGNMRTENLYEQHAWMLRHHAKIDGLELNEGLPVITTRLFSHYDRRKVSITDQWSSHPRTTERIARLSKLPEAAQKDSRSAWIFFRNAEQLQRDFSLKIFATVESKSNVELISYNQFIEAVERNADRFEIDRRYAGVYKAREIRPFNFEVVRKMDLPMARSIADIFNEEAVALSSELIGIQYDLELLTQIRDVPNRLKYFTYEGVRYKKKQVHEIIKKVTGREEVINIFFNTMDLKSFRFFDNMAWQTGEAETFCNDYQFYFDIQVRMQEYQSVLTQMKEVSHFMRTTTQIDDLPYKFNALQRVEQVFKPILAFLFNELQDADEVPADVRTAVAAYLAQQQIYFFRNNTYNLTTVNQLYTAMNLFGFMIDKTVHLARKRVLDRQMKLMEKTMARA